MTDTATSATRTWFTYQVRFTQDEIPDHAFRLSVPAMSPTSDVIASEVALAERIKQYAAPYFPGSDPLKALISPWGDFVIKRLDTEIAGGEITQLDAA